ncbi:Tn3 family transposase, partial [Escherichia coli]|uniref:Tn3 family transposase n=1 Tax=Escherichia coli TaxID=562 RepID=UPI001E4C664F
FSPRLADAGASVFWRMGNDADYGVLNDIARGQSDPQKIVLQWDEMIRAAGSLKLGKVQASVLIRSLLKSERPSGLTQAIIEVGRINKTLYLLNYIDDEDIARLSPLCHGHINMLGHYSFTLAELVTKGHLRPLKEASEEENIA